MVLVFNIVQGKKEEGKERGSKKQGPPFTFSFQYHKLYL